MWRDFFFFSKRERQGILILCIFLGGILLGKYIFLPKPPLPLQEENTLEIKKNEAFIEQKDDSLKSVSKVTLKPQKQQEERRTYYTPKKNTLINQNINNYPKSKKLTSGQCVELNSADTSELKRIPGIGSAYARRIFKYREALGGFYHTKQLQEVYGMYEELFEKISPYIVTDEKKIRPIYINAFSLERLKAHPYLNFYQAKAIIELRRKKKKLEKLQDLELLEEFSKEDIERLGHYVMF